MKRSKDDFLSIKIKELESENSQLKTQLEINKKILLSKDEIFKEKEENLEKLKITYENAIKEAKQRENEYRNLIFNINKLKAKYEKDMQALLKKIRKQTNK